MAMQQFDLFSFFNGGEEVADLSTMDFFPQPVVEKETKKAPKPKKEVELEEAEEEEDDSMMELSLDAEEPKTDSKAKTSSKSKGKKKGATGESKIMLPVVCHGRNWCYKLEGFGEKTLNEVLADLYAAGYLEVAHNDVGPLGDEKLLKSGHIYFTSPTRAGKTDISLFSGYNRATILDGMEQMTLDLADFDGCSKDEVSVFDGQLKFEKSFPVYADQDLNFVAKAAVAIPVLKETISAGTSVNLPFTLVVDGTRQEVTKEFFPMSDTVTGKDIVERFFLGAESITTLKTANGVIFGEYTGTVATGLKRPGQIGGVEQQVKEFYTLPCNCYFVTLNQTVSLTSEMFGGKEKIDQADLLSLLRQTYSILRNKDRRVEVVYVKEQNLVSVALTSGTKGSSYAIPEIHTTGLFKLIRTVEELAEVKKLSSFLGNFVPENGPSQRVEVCPHGVFIATKGEGRELLKIKEVSFERKLPKIPARLFQGVLEDFKAHPQIERIVQVRWNTKKQEYFLAFPSCEQSGKGFIHYHFAMPTQEVYTVLTIHSHNTMPAYFSGTDDRDEAITGLYGVVGTIDKTPTYKFRVGVEGVFCELDYSELFEEV